MSTIVDSYYSVEISLRNIFFVHQFKIWDISPNGKCILVKEDSDLLSYLKVGDILDMKYSATDLSQPAESLRTEIKHIGKDDDGRFKGHYLIGISVLEN